MLTRFAVLGTSPRWKGDRKKALQFLINLVQNAKHALGDGDGPDKRLMVRVASGKQDRVRVEVIDAGVGIPPENMSRIYSHGFTTRKDGRGFGPQNAALTAKEMGDSLLAFMMAPGRRPGSSPTCHFRP